MKPFLAVIAAFAALAAAPAFAASAAPKPSPSCVDVQIGTDRAAAFDCLNQTFQRNVAREHAMPPPDAPIDARSSSVSVGTANESAARQRMGTAFGVTAVPQRPVRVYAPQLPLPAPR